MFVIIDLGPSWQVLKVAFIKRTEWDAEWDDPLLVVRLSH